MTSPSRSLKILLVENHEDTLKYLSKYLEIQGHDVCGTRDMASAIKALSASKFDILISDIGLPDGTGIELMEKLNTEHSMVGIALTGFGMEDDVRKSRAVGFREHLVKPVDLNKLDSVLQEFALSR